MSQLRHVSPEPLPDERAPLLAGAEVQNHDGTFEGDEENATKPEETAKSWNYAWIALWIIIATVVIAIFAKAWHDADDVDVLNTFEPKFVVLD